ncbi:MAG: cytochrome c biogenesis protein [Firmicutes bacterium]|nr:cytochrome c biogenesis protein [Bacillota bacterium]
MPTSTAALLLYAVSLALYLWLLYTNRSWMGFGASALLAGGLLLHYFSLMERARALDSVPYQDLPGSLSLFAWLLALTYLGLEVFHRQRSVGAFVVPVVFVLALFSTLFAPQQPPAPPETHSTLFALHVTLNILAYSSFAIAFVLSVIFLLQNRMLRGRAPGRTFWRFPALELLERMSRSSVAVGLLALLAGIGLGLVVSRDVRGQLWSNDPKEIVSVVILLGYAAYLWLGRTTTWRGARASWLCVINFVVVLFSLTIVNLYWSKFHRYF